MRVSRWIAALAVLAAAVACGSDGGGGGGPTGPVTVTGTFVGNHTFTFGGLDIGTCTGSVTVDQQTGDSFSGTLTVDNAGLCMDFGDSGPITGTIDGSQIRIDLDGFGIEELLADVGCVPAGGESLFIGRLDGDRLTATLSRDFNCPDQGVGGAATWSIEATRS